MKTKSIFGWVALFALFVTSVIFGIGCKKTDSPFGVYDPNGVDNPFVPGSFNVSVQDNGAPVSGVNVQLVDSVGTTLMGQTASSGIAAFNPVSIMTGAWNAIVPTQSVTISNLPLTVDSFYQSVQPVTVASTGLQAVTFNAPTQSVSIWSLNTTETYPYGGTNLFYGVTYIQPGNLNEPVSLSIVPTAPSTFFPSNWSTNYSNVVLGNGSDSGTVTIEIPCAVYQPYFEIKATKSDGVSFLTVSRHITRNFFINVQLNQFSTGLCSDLNTGSPALSYSVLLQTQNDCGITWTVTGVGNGNFVNGATISSQNCEGANISGTTISNSQVGSFTFTNGNSVNF